MTKSTQVVAAEPQAEASNVLQVISRAAADPSVDIEKLERLLAMQERITARNAQAEYASALADMQPQLPMIGERGGIKDRNGNVQSRYALWEDIVTTITPVLSAYGFALSFRTANADNTVSVTGVLTHRAGHSESTTLALPIDTSGSKNAVQSVGSSTSYGKRYTASALLNLRTGDVDDDGNLGGDEPRVDENQIANLQALMQEVGADKARFFAYLKIGALEEIYARNYASVVKLLESKRARS